MKPCSCSTDSAGSQDLALYAAAGGRSADSDSSAAFWATVCHELRTPLTSLLGFSALGKKSFDRHFMPLAEDEKTRDHGRKILRNLTMIEQAGWRLSRLIGDVQDLHRIQSGRMRWHDQDVFVPDAVTEAVRQVQPLYDAKPEVRLKTEVTDALPPLRMDMDRLVQVLVNLLSNGVRFTPSGCVTLAADLVDDTIRIQVQDTGVGIAAENLEAVFQPFHQPSSQPSSASQDASRMTIPRETGLGLALCGGIIEHYQGRIWAESVPDGGSAFIVTLPVPLPTSNQPSIASR